MVIDENNIIVWQTAFFFVVAKFCYWLFKSVANSWGSIEFATVNF